MIDYQKATKDLNYQHIAEEYYKRMTEQMSDDTTHSIYQQYPLDIIHDVHRILESKPIMALFLCKEYISTQIVDLYDDLIAYDETENYRNIAHVGMLEYTIRNLSDYKHCRLLFFGVFHYFDLENDIDKKYILNILNFYLGIYKRRMKIVGKPLT